jgi:ribonucleoside-triphosphate reductase
MSIKALQEYTRFSKYAKYNPEAGRREFWDEQVERVFKMHREKLGESLYGQIKDDMEFAQRMVEKKRVLGSQRALQFGGAPILKKHSRIFNCTVSYCDRPRFFQECIYLLLCGCGCGFSVQKHHVDKLPKLSLPSSEKKVYQIPDSIEGWSDALGILMCSYFDSDLTEFQEYRGVQVEFDYSLIRPEGSSLSSGGKAPGPDGLMRALEKIRYLLNKTTIHNGKLRPIDAYDVCMHASDAVLSGGIRRSASISIFSPDDEEMIKAKTGSWFIENPQRGRSNNSVLLVRNETSKEQFSQLMHSVKEFGEPGFIWTENKETLYNPCVEIGFCAYLDLTDKKNEKIINSSKEYQDSIEIEKKRQNNDSILSGWAFCNLCEINMKKCKTEEEFMESCRAASIIGSVQASYSHFPYLGGVTDMIVKREALLGVSMTGMADSPDIAFNPEIQRKGAKVVLDTNEKISKIIGTNVCARGTCVKPAGSTSCVLGSASGIHPHHAKRYLRRVQANKLEVPLQHFQKYNPLAIENSVWSANNTDVVVTFLCEVPDGVKTKNQVNAITLLENVKLTQQNWVEYGTRVEECIRPWLRHNVSNTCTVKPDEWEAVENFIYDNKAWFAGISLLPASGDKDYPQAPFTAVYTPTETVRKYGDGSLFGSGLIVDGHHAFDNDLWAACDCALGVGEVLDTKSLRSKIEIAFRTNGQYWKDEGLSPESPERLLSAWLKHNVKNYNKKIDWVRRSKQFANRYFNDDLREMTYCLKDIYNWKVWCDLSREYVEVDWSQCFETEQGAMDTEAGSACSGGKCELGDLGIMIEQKQQDKLKQ